MRYEIQAKGARQMKIAALFAPFAGVFFLDFSSEQLYAVLGIMTIVACTWFIAGAEAIKEKR